MKVSMRELEERIFGTAPVRGRPLQHDLTGQTFGRWHVEGRSRTPGYWVCRCQCGTKRHVGQQSLLNGTSVSCRCFSRDKRGSSEIAQRVEAILQLTAEHCDETGARLKDKCRSQPLVHVRHLAMWLAQKETTASLPAIGRVFGDRDHTTVLHAVRTMSERIKTEPEWGKLAVQLRRAVQAMQAKAEAA